MTNYVNFKVTHDEMMKIMRDRHVDLVSKPLVDLNVQAGDVVEDSITSDVYEILDVSNDGVFGKSRKDGKVLKLYMLAKGRIVSRAQPQPKGPVITETVTTEVKRIVAGVYGKVYVHGDDGYGKIMVGLTDETDDRDLDGYDCATMSCDDLTAAIETLTQVRDAMADSTST